ncbi:uncharacterized protein [Ambystoma mexicanum]|uniref:uncharacterized protein isoform X2 n=1 Tax=Ambystoma mexicanum TaxID=8296 RepID=UPI0037E73EF2
MATAADTSSMATHDAITKPAKQTPAGPCAYLLPRLACHSPPALNGGGVGCEVKPGEEGRRKRPALLFAALLRAHIKAAPKSAVCLRFGDVDSKSTLFALPEGIKMAAAADSSSMATHDATTKPAKQTPAGPCAYSLRQLAFHSPPALNGGGVGREAKPGEEGHRKKAGRCSSTHYNQALAELPTASQARPSLRLYHSPEKTQHVPRKLTPETDLHHLDADACLVPTILLLAGVVVEDSPEPGPSTDGHVLLQPQVRILEIYHILGSRQSGFRPGHGMESAFLDLKKQPYNIRDMGKRACLLDLSAAFDLVDHNILWYHLTAAANFSQEVTTCVASFLEGRSKRVFSDLASVPLIPSPGSCVSPTL